MCVRVLLVISLRQSYGTVHSLENLLLYCETASFSIVLYNHTHLNTHKQTHSKPVIYQIQVLYMYILFSMQFFAPNILLLEIRSGTAGGRFKEYNP